MTHPRHENSLYLHLASAINQALPLEYGLRAARQAFPEQMEKLAGIDQELSQYWLSLGLTPAEVQHDRLTDLSWDCLQTGLSLSRRDGRVFTDQIYVDLINHGLANTVATFREAVGKQHTPAADYFRICDLLNGNDIPRLLREVARCLNDAESLCKEDDVALEMFIHGIREPIRLHPALRYVTSNKPVGQRNIECFGIVLDTEMDFSASELDQMLQEFRYQFAQRRRALRRQHLRDPLSDALIGSFLKAQLLGQFEPHRANRLDGLLGPLAGLHCWDLVRQYRAEGRDAPVNSAIEATEAVYPNGFHKVGWDAHKKNYYNAVRAIDALPFSRSAKTRTGPSKRASD